MRTGRNVLVAGGTGLVGTNLTHRLLTLGAHVRATYCSHKPVDMNGIYQRFDLTEFDDCLEATRDIDDVVICAAVTSGAKIMKEQPSSLILPNLKINAGLLEACRVNRVERVLLISSSTVYQEAAFPIREDQLDLNQQPYELYRGVAWMKRYLEQLAGFYAARYGMRIGIVRPSNIYGPHDKFDPETAHVLPALIRRAVEKETPYVVWGDGKAVRDFIYVEDLVGDLLDVLEHHCVGDPINLASGQALTIAEAVEVILDVCGHHVRPVYDPSKPDAIPYRRLDTTNFEQRLSRKARTPFREGIRRTVAWYSRQLCLAQRGMEGDDNN